MHWNDHRAPRRRIISTLAAFIIALGLIQPVWVQADIERDIASQSPGVLRPTIVYSSKHDLSPQLGTLRARSLPQVEGIQIPSLQLPKALINRGKSSRDESIVQSSFFQRELRIPAAMPAPLQSFDGVSNLFGGWPPDTQGDIGPNHYVQWINLHFAIWEIDKENNTATKVYGPVPGNTIFQGFGGECEYNNDGDPITLYDPFVDRWFMSQFALPNWPNGPFYECVAVSQTGNPTGAWHRYAFQMPVNKMNDYPKFGVWPDAYYMTVNQYNAGSMSWGGVGVAALERSAMLNGESARMVYFDLYSVDSDFGGMLPADFDGLTPPPEGAPGYFAEWDDGDWIPPSDSIRIWEFDVNWADPGSSTFGLSGQPNQVIPTADVDPDMCGGDRNCIPQPGTVNQLDAISDRLMHRLQYRNFSGYETLVSNHTVDVDGTDHAGVHWLELRRSAGTWSLHQEGVYAPPDTDNRWMGSAAMDHNGNIALGYSVSSGSTYPSVRYTGRLASDPPGSMTHVEASLVEGSGSQTSSNRWGDYSMMAVDPVDDCTFWYTQEYIATTGSNYWKTRIGSFRFPNCSIGPRGTLQGTVSDSSSGLKIEGAQVVATQSITQTYTTNTQSDGNYSITVPIGAYQVTASAFGYETETVSGVEVFTDTTTIQNFILTQSPHYTVSGVINDARVGWPLYAIIAFKDAPVDPLWSDPVTGFYSITLPVGITYTLQVDAFVDGYLPAIVEIPSLTGDLMKDISLEVDEISCSAPGYGHPSPVYSSTFEMDDGGLIPSGTTSWDWGAPSSGPNDAYSGNNVWATNLAGDYNNNEDGYLTSPAIDLSAYTGQNLVVSWVQWLRSEENWDFARLEVTKNSGANWDQVFGPQSGAVDLAWAEYTQLLDSSYAVNDFQARFHFDTDSFVTFPGWYLDDLAVGVARCEPLPGGLVVGNVYDGNTSLGLVGASVRNEFGGAVPSQATPLDSSAPDGFFTMFSPAGAVVLTATMEGGYQAVVETTSVPLSDTIQQDFTLPAGWLVNNPPSLDVNLDLGSTLTRPLTLTNQGEATATFELVELNRGSLPLGPIDEPLFVVKPFKQDLPTSESLNLPEPPPAAPLEAGDVIQSWTPTGAPGVWGLAYDGVNDTVWTSSPAPYWDGNDALYEFSTQGVSTGRSYPHTSPHSAGPADLAFNWHTGMLWVMNVNTGTANCIYEVDPASGYTGESICPGGGSGFSISQRGLAYDPETDTWFAGGWNDLMVHRFDSQGNILSSVNVGLSISGLAYNPDSEHLFVMVQDSPNPVYILDASQPGYDLLGQFSVDEGFGSYSGAGLEIDCEGSLWAMDLESNLIVQFESGEGADFCNRDVPWLSESPSSGSAPGMTDQQVDVGFNANIPEVDQPGVYRAQLKILEDTPYSPSNIPVTMTVNAPPTWGRLTGTVTGLGYCNQDPTPLQYAQILIESSSGMTWTLETDVDGYYERWLDQAGNMFTVTVTATGHTTSQATGVEVLGEQTVIQDFGLYALLPCIDYDPPSMSVALKQGRSVELTLTLTNTGYSATEFEFWEVPLEGASPDSGSVVISPAGEGPEDARLAPSQIGFSQPIYTPHGSAILLDQGFESGVIPPADWTQIINNANTWAIETRKPHSGNFYTNVFYDFEQNEWLLSPEIYLSEGVLSFWSYGSTYWCRDVYDNCDINIWIVIDEVGGGDDIYVGSADGSWQGTWIWSQSVFDLTSLVPGGLVRIGFQYLGDDGAEAALDDILLEGVEGVDIPWVTLSPISGTLPATSFVPIDVTFEAGNPDLMDPGEYYALVKLLSTDPMHGNLSIPVTMTVIPLDYGVQLSEDMIGHDIAGETVNYTLTVTNTSEGPADTFSLSLGDHDWSTQLGQPEVGPLDMGQAAQFNLQVEIPPLASPGEWDSVVITATSQGDPTKSDSSTISTAADIPSADLQVLKGISSDPAWVGNVVTYTLVVINHGPTKSRRVTLVDVLPAGVIYLSDDSGCALDGYVLSCELGKMEVGATRVVELLVKPMQLGPLINQAVVVADTPDPTRENNWATLHSQVDGYLIYFPYIANGVWDSDD